MIIGSLLKTKDFLEKNYIPKFIASSKIAMNPSEYGFKVIEPKLQPELLQFEIPPLVSLTLLSELIKIPKRKLREYNPAILRQRTPAFSYKIWVPKKSVETLKLAKKTILRESKRQLAQYKKLVPRGIIK